MQLCCMSSRTKIANGAVLGIYARALRPRNLPRLGELFFDDISSSY